MCHSHHHHHHHIIKQIHVIIFAGCFCSPLQLLHIRQLWKVLIFILMLIIITIIMFIIIILTLLEMLLIHITLISIMISMIISNILIVSLIRYGHCYEYLSGGAMFSACSCLAGSNSSNHPHHRHL